MPNTSSVMTRPRQSLTEMLPAIFIRDRMKDQKVTRTQLVSLTGYTSAQFSKILNDNARITPAFSYALSKVLRFDPLELMIIQSDLDLKRERYLETRAMDGVSPTKANEDFDGICMEMLRSYSREEQA